MIEVTQLTRRYGDLTAVDNVSFGIERGEVVGLLGHNGAGKTTIMKMLTGFLEPSAGSVRVDGLDIQDDRRAIQARIGYLPENCPLWSDMVVLDYLEFQARLKGLDESQSRQAVRRAIALTALKSKAAQPIHTLSRGYRQRVGVAQALLQRPDIVILDEPTNGLDPTQIQQMRGLIRDLAEQATVIVSTHVLQEVQAVCDRVLILRAGKLAVDERLADLQQRKGLLVDLDADGAELLRSVEGVSQVQALPSVDGRYRHQVTAVPEVAPELVRRLVQAGLRVYGICPQQRDLEALFRQVDQARAGEVHHG